MDYLIKKIVTYKYGLEFKYDGYDYNSRFIFSTTKELNTKEEVFNSFKSKISKTSLWLSGNPKDDGITSKYITIIWNNIPRIIPNYLNLSLSDGLLKEDPNLYTISNPDTKKYREFLLSNNMVDTILDKYLPYVSNITKG